MLLNIIYPRRCPICDSVLKNGSRNETCGKCVKKVRYIEEPFCKKCGKPLEYDYIEYCGDCKGKITSYKYGMAVFEYSMYIRDSISRFKYNGRREYAGYYSECMYDKYRGWINKVSPDAFIPVPIHTKRMRKRGYNQAELIALELGKKCSIPVISDYIYRCKNTCPQKMLSPSERAGNVNDAFMVSDATKELYQNVKCVIIIDDIYTTGSTIEACSHTLREAGVNDIYFMCVSIGRGF